ncbi:MAG TPA: acetate--CoA ligase family protein [Ktedonobacteraceae bacterium]|jgi:acyl-CoA synthetase (NDP forming)|nr:acetate--CoA ligase family protein [Ktedonobacteraceae bacterium]
MTEPRQISAEQLQHFFHPRSIALVGATDNSRWSIYTFENLKNFGFPGPIYLVNPNREIVHGERAYKTLSNLPEPVDLAFVMVSTPRVLPIVQEAARLGTKCFVVLTSGFSETGAEGARLERELLDFAHEHALTLLGPNGNGFINVTSRITPYGLPIAPPLQSGPVGVVLQSGALTSAVLAFAQAHGIGLSLLVAMGNESMISVTDVMDYLLEDEATRSIALFLESIRQPDELRRVAEKAREKRKAIVALKIGRSEASSRAAFAHTGALVGNDRVNDAALRQLGIMRVSSLEDLLTTAGLAGYSQPLPGRRMGVVTPSGGACDILSDLSEEVGIALPQFAPETVERLQSVLPPFSTCHNPLDVTGYIVVDATLQQRALDVVVHDPNIDFVLYLTTTESGRDPTPEALAASLLLNDNLARIVRSAPHPVVITSNTCMDLSRTAKAVVERTGLYFLAGMEHGMRALGKFLWWSESISVTPSKAQQEPLPSIPQDTSFSGNWSEARARTLLEQAGIPVVPGLLVTSADEAVQAARELGLPVVLKIQSATLLHKSDVGGVALNLNTEEAVRGAFSAMMERVSRIHPFAEIEGVLVSPMRSAGIELLVGIVRDPLWGPVLTLGLGGIWTEVFKDTAVRVLPVSMDDIERMLGELRGAALLYGTRGQQRVDIQVLSQVIHRISSLALSLGPQLQVLEINPLLVTASRIEALDVLLSWQA